MAHQDDEALLQHDTRSKFSVGKIAKFCKQGRFSDRVGSGAPIFLAAVLEYLTAEILELAEHQLKAEKTKKGKVKRQRITPRHIMMAIKSDRELAQFFASAGFCGAGVLPSLVSKDARGKKKKKIDDSCTDSEDEDYGMDSD